MGIAIRAAIYKKVLDRLDSIDKIYKLKKYKRDI